MHSWILILVLLQVIITVYAFRDYPTNYSSFRNNNVGNTTVYEKYLTNILVRKKRGFVFFKGAVVVLTQVLSKHIVATAPRGVIHSSEVDMFYDLPILIEGWTKPLHDIVNRTKGGKKSDDVVEEGETFKNVGVINASAISYDKYSGVSATGSNRFLNKKNYWQKYNSPKRIYFYSKPYIRGPPRYSSYPNYYRRNFKQKQNQRKNYQYYRQSLKSQSPPKKMYQLADAQRLKPQFKKVNPISNDHREYRERRGIFEHVEGFGKKLGISLRSCILRAICEIKTELLPKGESFINDVARILFTIPTNHDNKDEDFVQMALEDGVDCMRRFMVSCPHSPLKYFFNNFRATSYPQMSEQDMMRNLMYA